MTFVLISETVKEHDVMVSKSLRVLDPQAIWHRVSSAKHVVSNSS